MRFANSYPFPDPIMMVAPWPSRGDVVVREVELYNFPDHVGKRRNRSIGVG